MGNSKLPQIATKQAINNLRFISNDGNFTYYQNKDGSLLLSTNYKVSPVLTSEPGTYYQVISGTERKKLAVTQRTYFHKDFNFKKLKSIYLIDFGGGSPKQIGKGVNPKFHFKDQWLSFFNPITKVIHFQNLKSSILNFEISIKNKRNPYFIPQVIMIDGNNILYTDLNNKGIPGILYYDRIKKETEILYKASYPSTKLELCLYKDSLYLGDFGLDHGLSGSQISKMPKKTIDFSKRKIIYESSLNDIGNIKCRDSIFFVKNLFKERKKISFEAVKIDNDGTNLKIISDVNFASHIINMDEVLLLPHLGKYYVLEGKSDFTKSDQLEKTENSPKTSKEVKK